MKFSKKDLASTSLILSLLYNGLKIINFIFKPISTFFNRNDLKKKYKQGERANEKKDIKKINDILKS